MLAACHEPVNLGALPRRTLQTPTDVQWSTLTAEQVLALLPVGAEYDHTYTHRAARFCHSNELSFETFLAWLRPKHDEKGSWWPDIERKWQGHWAVLPQFPGFTVARMKTVLLHFYPALREESRYRQFADTFLLPEQLVHRVETLTPAVFERPEKYLVLATGMGSGKTAQTIDRLRATSGSFVWVAPNKALGTNTLARFNALDEAGPPDAALKVKIYRDR